MTPPRIRLIAVDKRGNSTARGTFQITRTTSVRRFLPELGGGISEVFAYCLFAAIRSKHWKDQAEAPGEGR